MPMVHDGTMTIHPESLISRAMTAPTSRIAERDSDTARVLPGSVGNLEEADQTVRITVSATELI